MNRTRLVVFLVLVAINVALALVVTMRLSLPDLRPQSAVHFPAIGIVLTLFLAMLIAFGTAIGIGERVLVRRSEDGDAARGVGAFFRVWWLAGVGLALAVLVYQAYLIGWSRGVLPPLDQILHLRVGVTLFGAFHVYTGNVFPKTALAMSAMSPNEPPSVALREARHQGWVDTLYGVLLLVAAWTAPPLVLGPLWAISIFVFLAYKVIRGWFRSRQSRARAGEGVA